MNSCILMFHACRWLGVLLVLSTLLASQPTSARSITKTPPSDYTDIQKTEWSIGFRGSYLKKCNMFGIGKQIIDVMKLSPYGRKGINTYVSGTPTDYASVGDKIVPTYIKLHLKVSRSAMTSIAKCISLKPFA